MTASLVELFDKYKCDKGSSRHRYDRVYEPALEHLRSKPFSMLEIGVFRGTSLQVWLDYFPHASLVGIDVFTRVTPEEIEILKHPRIQWCKCNSLEGPNDQLNTIAQGGFDVIIDDGLHTHDAQRQTFENFIPYLNDGGVYFIEDVWPFDRMTLLQKRHHWITKHPNDFSDKQYQQLLDVLEPYNVTFHDLRSGHELDTFIIEIRK